MMTHAQLKQFIAEAVFLLIIGTVLVVGGYFISQDNANKRMQNEYHSRFDVVLDSYSYEKVKSKALNNYPEIEGVYIGHNATGSPEGYVIDLTVKSSGSEDLSMLVALDYESTRIVGLALNPNDSENAYVISDSDMEQIKDRLIGRQIPLAFLTEENRDDDDSEKPAIPGLQDGIYYAQRLYDDRNRYIDYVEMEVKNGVITKVKWDAFSTDKTNQDRSEASLRGAFVISGLDWATQSYNLCHALLECQDPDRLAMKSNGTTDIVDGVTCDIRPFIELSKECISYSQTGYNKDEYTRGLNILLGYLKTRETEEEEEEEEEPEEQDYVREDGHIVFSFEDTPEIYTIYNEDGVSIGYMGVRQAVATLMGVSLPENIYDNGSDDNESDVQNSNLIVYDGGEDGLTFGGNADDQVFTDSLDDLPMSEMQSFVEPVPEAYDQTRTVIKACNTCYKFLKEYLNWKV